MQDTEKNLGDDLSQKKEDTKNSSASKKKTGDIKIELKSLDQLIRENGGQDVEMQFYYDGKLIENSICFFEIWKQHQESLKDSSRPKKSAPPKFDKNDPAAYFKQMIMRQQNPNADG